MKTLHRTQLDQALRPYFAEIPRVKKTLDIGGGENSPYRKWVNTETYHVFDSNASTSPDIVGDAHDMKIKSNTYDLVIATEVLEHCHSPHLVVSEIRRVLKNGGICIGSVPFLYPYHGTKELRDYYRFTPEGAAFLLKDFSEKEIKPFGSGITFLLTALTKKIKYVKGLNPFFENQKSSNASGVVFWVKK